MNLRFDREKKDEYVNLYREFFRDLGFDNGKLKYHEGMLTQIQIDSINDLVDLLYKAYTEGSTYKYLESIGAKNTLAEEMDREILAIIKSCKITDEAKKSGPHARVRGISHAINNNSKNFTKHDDMYDGTNDVLERRVYNHIGVFKMLINDWFSKVRDKEMAEELK